jgi:hypothetical protein
MRIGINPAPPVYYSPQAPFLNHMLLRSPWLDAHGQPTRADGSAGPVHCQVPTLQYDAQYDVIVSANVTKVQVAATFTDGGGSGRTPKNGLVQFAAKRQASFQVSVTAAGPFRIAIVPSAYRARFDAGERFNPDFVASLSPFDMLRFMDWSRVNSSQLATSRALLSDGTFTDKGIPVEVQAELCNLTRERMWTNVPHLMMEHPDVVRDLVFAARKTLDPKLTSRFELSNEVWNPGFQQNAYALAHAKDASTWYGTTAAALSKIADDVAKALPGKVEIVLCGQPGHTGGIKSIVAAYRAAGGSEARFAAIASAPYLAADRKAVTALSKTGDVDGAIALIKAQLPSWAAYVQEWAAYAASEGKAFDAYETNVGVTTIPPDQAFCQKVQFDPRTADIFSAHLDNCQAAGMETACIFGDCQPAGNAGQWAMWHSPTEEPYPIGKAVISRAVKAKAAAVATPFVAEIAAIQAQLDDLRSRVTAALPAA